MVCNTCIGATEIADGLVTNEILDIYVLIAGDSMTGNLVVGDASCEGVSIGSTGVKLSDDQDGRLTVLGLGDG